MPRERTQDSREALVGSRCASCGTDDIGDEEFCGWCRPHALLKRDYEMAVAALRAQQRLLKLATVEHNWSCDRRQYPNHPQPQRCTCGVERVEREAEATMVAYESERSDA